MPIGDYIHTLALSSNTLDVGGPVPGAKGGLSFTGPEKPAVLSSNLRAAVDAGSILSFVDGLTAQEREDVLYSVQLAHRTASRDFDRFTQAQSWYQRYVEVLQMLGWTAEQLAFATYVQDQGEVRMDKAALSLITAIATQNQLAVLTEAVSALEKLAEDDGTIRLFDFHTSADVGGNFQLGAVQKAENGAISMAMGSFYFRADDARRRFLFVSWGRNEVNFWTAAQKMTLNRSLYGSGREAVKKKLEATFTRFVSELEI